MENDASDTGSYPTPACDPDSIYIPKPKPTELDGHYANEFCAIPIEIELIRALCTQHAKIVTALNHAREQNAPAEIITELEEREAGFEMNHQEQLNLLHAMLGKVRTYSDYWDAYRDSADVQLDHRLALQVKLLDIYAKTLRRKGEMDIQALCSEQVQAEIDRLVTNMASVLHGSAPR